MLSPLSFQSQIPIKGETSAFDFTIDTDHRKRRRNRTTQSCIHCHTSKRKCDRKRPCQRCTSLGLTGICVYEIDDPSSRDDPSIDETTRLRNRIAELESLVRELRGKPHPRWADTNFRDSDPWHSRAKGSAVLPNGTTSPASSRRRASDGSAERHHRSGIVGVGVTPSSLAPVKMEPIQDVTAAPQLHQHQQQHQEQLYRFSSSPDDVCSSPGLPFDSRYAPLPPDVSSSPSPGHGVHRHSYSAGSSSGASSTLSFTTSSSESAVSYGSLDTHQQHDTHHQRQQHPQQQHQPLHHHQPSSSPFPESTMVANASYHHMNGDEHHPRPRHPYAHHHNPHSQHHGYLGDLPTISPPPTPPTDGPPSGMVVEAYYCPCRTAPAVDNALLSLSSELRSALGTLRRFGAHGSGIGAGGSGVVGGAGGAASGSTEGDLRCGVYRQIVGLQNLLHAIGSGDCCGESTAPVVAAYDALPTPAESDILGSTAAPTTGGSPYHHTPGAGSSAAAVAGGQPSPHEWNAIATAGFSSYFSSEHTPYGNVMA